MDDLEEIQVGEGDGKSVDSVELKNGLLEAAKRNAAILGVTHGSVPLYDMTTPGGLKVGFPFPQARPFQLESVEAILAALFAGHNALFEAGTGVGKSAIAMAAATFFPSSWLLVGRNDLVDQWENDFKGFSEIGFYKARGRFECLNSEYGPDGQRPTCATGKSLCKRNKKRLEKEHQEWVDDGCKGTKPADPMPCPYATNRDLSLSKPHTAMTLSLGLTMFAHLFGKHPMVEKRDVLVIDECSELESELMKFHQCTISTKTIRRVVPFGTKISDIPNLPPATTFGLESEEVMDAIRERQPTTLKGAIEWVDWVGLILDHRARVLKKESEGGGQMAGASKEDLDAISIENEELIEEISNVKRQINSMKEAVATGLPYHFEVKEDTNWRNGRKTGEWQVVLSPLEARGLFDRLLSQMADHVIFVSATTGPATSFMAAHAMRRTVQHISLPSPFPVQNRPVLSFPSGNMARKTIDQDLPIVMNDLVRIAVSPKHDKQKGVVHTYTNKMTDAVVEAFTKAGLKDRVLILQGGGRQREEVMQLFRASATPYILVSPSAMLGLSLNDDLARWQVIVKVPYANIGDPSVSHRMNAIPGWYEWQTAKDLIQTFGRICRSMNDWGITYILDSGFQGFYKRNRNLFPPYVQSAIQLM